ncbi:uncharacterized protein LOC124454529 [Xenia sp. Carnegie-2017]|uniref:uncharacterized protein LOC124454529 n=1 Tax=Xenia sp. Carnegie-2017 TaxID=2897299 RepID=UPI001F041FAD|nr:uncharacterized protein LOC124454529 [Xenia sp. Carnegie-2017]
MLTICTTQGRFDINSTSFKCVSCSAFLMPTLADILGNGYWPANPKSLNVLFSQDLLLLWNTMQKRMPGCSESSFIRSLEDISVSKGRFGSINPRTFTKAFREWKYFNYEVEKAQGKEWMFCPSCSSNQHSCHVDGNMKLYRYKHSGREQSQSYYGDLFISSNEHVSEHIRKVYSTPQVRNFSDDGKCGESNWRAAGNKGKRKSRLDETGLEIAGCRHAIAQWAVNMFRGEIYGYSNYIHVHKMIPNNVKYIWQDIICKYWKWAVKASKSDESNAHEIKPALSVMHAKAHNWTCQVLWGGRWQKRFCIFHRRGS